MGFHSGEYVAIGWARYCEGAENGAMIEEFGEGVHGERSAPMSATKSREPRPDMR